MSEKKVRGIYCTEEERELLKQYLQKIRLGIQDDDVKVKVPDWVNDGLRDHSEQLEQVWSVLNQIAKINKDGTWSIKQPVESKPPAVSATELCKQILDKNSAGLNF